MRLNARIGRVHDLPDQPEAFGVRPGVATPSARVIGLFKFSMTLLVECWRVKRRRGQVPRGRTLPNNRRTPVLTSHPSKAGGLFRVSRIE